MIEPTDTQMRPFFAHVSSPQEEGVLLKRGLTQLHFPKGLGKRNSDFIRSSPSCSRCH